MNYDEYLQLDLDSRFKYFMNTRFPTNRTPAYWVKWSNISNNIQEHELNLNTLNYLVGRANIESEAKKLFLSQPKLLKSIPILLAARDTNFKVFEIDNNQQMSYYELDFNNPDLDRIDDYISFMHDSGILDFLQQKLNKSLVDYVYGVEVGLDSNGRKNRSGTQNEIILEMNLQKLTANNDWQYKTQATAAWILKNWNLTVPEALDTKKNGGRRYDGAVYNPSTNKVTVIETNFYGGGGSKLKSVSGEFSSIYSDSLRDAPEANFVWISDGPGWDTAKNPMYEAFGIIPSIFNLRMVNDDFLRQFIERN